MNRFFPTVARQCSVLFLLAALLIMTGCQNESTSQPVADSPPITSQDGVTLKVTLTIVTPDQEGIATTTKHEVDYRSELTAFSILEAAGVKVESTGQGETRFVTAIAGTENLGSAGDNWVFRVNQKLGDRSSDLVKLQPGDHVQWTFGAYQPEPDSSK